VLSTGQLSKNILSKNIGTFSFTTYPARCADSFKMRDNTPTVISLGFSDEKNSSKDSVADCYSDWN
jgi:hypothetical protein